MSLFARLSGMRMCKLKKLVVEQSSTCAPVHINNIAGAQLLSNYIGHGLLRVSFWRSYAPMSCNSLGTLLQGDAQAQVCLRALSSSGQHGQVCKSFSGISAGRMAHKVGERFVFFGFSI